MCSYFFYILSTHAAICKLLSTNLCAPVTTFFSRCCSPHGLLALAEAFAILNQHVITGWCASDQQMSNAKEPVAVEMFPRHCVCDDNMSLFLSFLFFLPGKETSAGQ